jgi:undecaprenyl-phosphate 4-deoxy-4-formamido-L-arabinose transferase
MPRPRIDRPITDTHSDRGYRVSIVIPVYRGEKTVGFLVHKLVAAMGQAYDLEIVLVDDGSPDDSARVCRELADELSQVRFLGLSKNYGEHNAVMAGLNHAGGDCVVIMDDDFQNPPEEVGRLVEELRRGYDVVFTYYEKKRHSPLRNLGSRFNDCVARLLLNKPRDLYLSSFKALSRFTVDELVKYTGPYPYIDGLILRFTRHYSRVLVRHDPRAEGRSGYTLTKLVGLWLNMFTNFSVLPLRLASCAGFLFAFLGLVGAACFTVDKLRHPDLPMGWASLIVSLFVVSGVQLFALGMIGEYLGRLFLKDNGQPQFVVRERHHCQDQARKSSEAA